jgi:hypothetical protein
MSGGGPWPPSRRPLGSGLASDRTESLLCAQRPGHLPAERQGCHCGLLLSNQLGEFRVAEVQSAVSAMAPIRSFEELISPHNRLSLNAAAAASGLLLRPE